MNELLLRSWWMPALRSTAGISFALLPAAWTDLSLHTLIVLFAGYAVVGGGACIAGALLHRRTDPAWWLTLLIGIVSIGAGVVALTGPGITPLILLGIIGANALIVGILDLVLATRLPPVFKHAWLLLAAGGASVLFALLAFIFPGDGALDRAWLITLYALITGGLLLALALRVRAWARERAGLLAQAASSESQRARTVSRLETTERLYRLLWENIAQAVCIIGTDLRIRYANPAVRRLFGYAPEELIGRDIGVKESAASRDTSRPRLQAYLEEEDRVAEPEIFEETGRRKNGEEFPVEVSLSRVDLEGERHLAAFYRDITGRKLAETEQARHTMQLQALAHASLAINQQSSIEAMMQAIVDQAREIIGAHQVVASLTANEAYAQEVKGLSLSDKYARYRGMDVPPTGSGIYAMVCETNQPLRLTQRAIADHPRWRGFGGQRDAHPPLRGLLAVPLVAHDGNNLGVIMLSDKYFGDFTAADEAIAMQLAQIASVAIENLRLLQQERHLEEKYRSIFETTIEGIFQTAVNGRFLLANPAFARMLGYDTPDQILQLSAAEALRLFADQSARMELCRQADTSGAVSRFEVELRGKSAEHVWVAGSVRALRDAQDQVLAHEWAVEDITERKKAQQRVDYLAQHDVLTGLPNRSLFAERTLGALERAKQDGSLTAVLFIDIDRFKHVNDTLGHAQGDEVLKLLAARLSGSLDKDNTLARFGGDEFALLITSARSRRDIEAATRHVLNAVREPLAVGKRRILLTASIGVSVYPSDAGDVASIFKNADIAMYRAKQEGRDTVRFYAARMAQAIPAQFDLEVQLRGALQRGELVLHYQPRIGLADGEITGVEALVRWLHPTKGLLTPSKFLPLAEETGIILALGEWVLETAVGQHKTWVEKGILNKCVAVNLSMRQLNRRQLTQDIATIIRQCGIEPGGLELEVTETSAMQDVARTIPILQELRRLGLAIAIDDFGAGYSSLNYLKQVPAQYLKIDQTFVRGVTTDESDTEIVRTIMALARNLRFKVIAEGVETAEQLRFLRREGCDEAQGYLFSRPLPALELEALIQRWKPPT